MSGAGRTLCIALAALLSGCASSVDVAFDGGRDFSSYATWDWRARGSSVAGAPGEGREHLLDALLARFVERELGSHGLARVRAQADLLVTCRLSVVRQHVAVNETGAANLLVSHHSSPSYLVQTTETRIDVYHDGDLRIDLTDRRTGELVWRGALRTRRRGDFEPGLAESIAELLAHLPVLGLSTAAAEGILPSAEGVGVPH